MKKMHCKLKSSNAIFTVLLLFVSLLWFSVLQYKLQELEIYLSSFNFVLYLSPYFYSEPVALFWINNQFLYSYNIPGTFAVSIQISLGSLSTLLLHSCSWAVE